MKTAKGTQLSSEDQKRVLAMFVHRFTGDHKPNWANKPWKDGKPYPVQFSTDADWLEHTNFAVRKNGRLDNRSHYCECNPTWPNNPELRKVH